MKGFIQDGEVNDVLSRVRQAEQYMEGWHKNIDKWRGHYNIKQGKSGEYKDPTFMNTVDLSVGIMLGNRLRWHAFGVSPSKKEQESTAKMEKLIQSILLMNNMREEKDLLYELFLNFNRDGGGVIYSVYDPTLEKQFMTTEEVVSPDDESGVETINVLSETPIRVQVIDPKKFIAFPGGPKRWLMAGRKESMTVLDVELLFGIELEDYAHLTDVDKSVTFGDFVDVWDYISQDGELKVRNTVLFNNSAIRGPKIMNGYKELPYTFQFFKPIGEKSSEWHNIMVPLETSLMMLEKSVNRRAHQIDVFSALPLVTKTQHGRVVQVDPGLYNHVNLSTDEDIIFPRWPGNPPDVREHQDFLRSRTQQSGFSDVMFGSGVGQIAGYALSQLGDQNRIRLEQPIKHLNLLLTVWAKKAISLLQEFAGDTHLCMYGVHKGKDFQDYITVEEMSGYAIIADIIAKFPNEETRKVAMSTQAKGLLSNYTIRERYYNIEQPEDEEERMLLEAVTMHPVAIQYAIITELTERAETGDKVAEMTLAALMSSGLPGMAGRPKEGNNPEQLTGTQSPTGQPVPQAEGKQAPGQSVVDEMERLAGASPNMEGGV